MVTPAAVYRPGHPERTSFHQLFERHFDRYVAAHRTSPATRARWPQYCSDRVDSTITSTGLCSRNQRLEVALHDRYELGEPIRVATGYEHQVVDIRTLLNGACSEEPVERALAARTLGSIGSTTTGDPRHGDTADRPQVEGVVSRLVALLDDPAPEPPLAAVRALGQIGPSARSAMPALLELMEQSVGNHLQACIVAVSRLGLKDPPRSTRSPAWLVTLPNRQLTRETTSTEERWRDSRPVLHGCHRR